MPWNFPAEELALYYSEWKRRMIFYREELYRSYIDTLGGAHLKLFIIMTDVMELQLTIRDLSGQGSGNSSPDEIRENAQKKLNEIRKLINRNSASLLYNPTALPDNNLINGLTRLLRQVAGMAHPVFFTEPQERRRAAILLRSAEKAYRQADLTAMTEIAGRAARLVRDSRNGERRTMPEEKIRSETESIKAAIIDTENLFPFFPGERIYNPEWVKQRKRMLEEEYAHMLEKKNTYENKIRNMLKNI